LRLLMLRERESVCIREKRIVDWLTPNFCKCWSKSMKFVLTTFKAYLRIGDISSEFWRRY
jgi:hypothetical protein